MEEKNVAECGIYRISSILEDTGIYAAVTRWISRTISADGTSSLGDCMETLNVLDTLGDICIRLYKAGPSLPALDLAILCRHHAVLLSDDPDTNMAVRLFSLGSSLLDRFAVLGSESELNWAIKHLTRANGISQGEHVLLITISHQLSKAHTIRAIWQPR